MGRIWLVPLILLVWVCGARTADACSCAARSVRCGPPGDFWRASAVFTGRVLTVERAGSRSSEHRVRVHLIQRFRGALTAPGGNLLIFTPAVCQYPFKAGQDYFIYAARQDDGRMTTSICTGTRPLAHAEGDLAYGRGVAADDVPTGKIVGEVRHAPQHDPSRKPVPDVPVTLTIEGVTLTTATDQRGRFAFETATAGNYALNVALPGSRYVSQPAQSLELPDPRACIETRVEAFFDGRVAGRVVDAGGKGVAGLTVAHVRSPGGRGSSPERKRTLTSDDGTFRIEKLPPGPFVLAVELPTDAFRDNDELSGIGMRGTLGAGDRLTLPPLSLPSQVRIAHLGGTVHTADGSPAPGARVFLKSGGENGHILGEPAVADGLGRFLIAVLEGEPYEVFAERPVSRMQAFRTEFSTPVAISASRDMPPLRLTIRRQF